MFTLPDHIDLLSLIIGAVLGAPIGFWFNSVASSARLGWGSFGGGTGVAGGFIYGAVANTPGFVGLRIGETRLLGRKIFGPFTRGVHYERALARDCTARLIDLDSDTIWQLYFRDEADPSKIESKVTLASGERKTLILMANGGFGSTGYFPFKPDWKDPARIVAPEERWMFFTTKRFRVEVRYGPSGSRRLTKELRIIPDSDGISYRLGRPGREVRGSFRTRA